MTPVHYNRIYILHIIVFYFCVVISVQLIRLQTIVFSTKKTDVAFVSYCLLEQFTNNELYIVT